MNSAVRNDQKSMAMILMVTMKTAELKPKEKKEQKGTKNG